MIDPTTDTIAHVKITYDGHVYWAYLYESLPVWRDAPPVDRASGDTPTQAVQSLMEKGNLQ